MKKYTIVTATLLLAGLLAFSPVAIGQGTGIDTGKQTTTMKMHEKKGMMREKGAANLTDQQRELISKLHQTFREENADTLKQLMTKQFDLKTILDSPKPDVEKAKAVQKEISDLNAKLAQKRIDFYIELRKINPDAKFGPQEEGLGMRGMMGMGHGSY
jgi:zinc resistance-associated protein